MQDTNDDLRAAIQQKDTKQDRRDRAVRRAHDAGASLQVIADVLDVHRTCVRQIVKFEKVPSERVAGSGYERYATL